MNWELRKAVNTDWIQDASEVYTFINWSTTEKAVRVDIMNAITDEPMISFIGPADAVRKDVTRWLSDHVSHVSLEHAAYIGQQIEKANAMQDTFMQD